MAEYTSLVHQQPGVYAVAGKLTSRYDQIVTTKLVEGVDSSSEAFAQCLTELSVSHSSPSLQTVKTILMPGGNALVVKSYGRRPRGVQPLWRWRSGVDQRRWYKSADGTTLAVGDAAPLTTFPTLEVFYFHESTSFGDAVGSWAIATVGKTNSGSFTLLGTSLAAGKVMFRGFSGEWEVNSGYNVCGNWLMFSVTSAPDGWQFVRTDNTGKLTSVTPVNYEQSSFPSLPS